MQTTELTTEDLVQRIERAERLVRRLAQALAAYAPAHPLLVDPES